MSDENKQLTVAELLARAGRETGDTEVPRRRRRRSLEEGGVSVAELTGSIPAVKEKPVESRHSAVPIDGPPPAPKPKPKPEPEPEPQPEPPTPGTDETAVLEKVEPVDEPVTGEIPVQEEPPADEVAEVVSSDGEADEGGVEKHEDAAPEVEEKTSVTGVILMTVIGVVLGVVVFKSFELLWENLTRPLVAGLALLVTVGLVAVVKVLRTANDGLSMFLAAMVGIAMTFGPLAVVLL